MRRELGCGIHKPLEIGTRGAGQDNSGKQSAYLVPGLTEDKEFVREVISLFPAPQPVLRPWTGNIQPEPAPDLRPQQDLRLSVPGVAASLWI